MTVERYSHIMHLTSQVSGELREGKGPIDVLRATLPAGTLSGAPKVRAMEIIDELEPTKRGIYGGVVGYLDFSGNLDTAIAIRTLVVGPDGRASVQAGPGIVADSDPQDRGRGVRPQGGRAAGRGGRRPAMSHGPPVDRAPVTSPAHWRPTTRRSVDGCGAYRLPRDVLTLSGPDAVAYLQGQCSQDVAGLAAGESTDALLLAPDGKLTALVRVVRGPRTGSWSMSRPASARRWSARLARFKLRSKVDMARSTGPVWPCGGQGWRAPRSANERLDRCRRMRRCRPSAARAVERGGGGRPAGARRRGRARRPGRGPGAGRGLGGPRVEAGIPAMGRELDERTIAAEAGLVERTVSFTKGCYTGQELVARLDSRGAGWPVVSVAWSRGR